MMNNLLALALFSFLIYHLICMWVWKKSTEIYMKRIKQLENISKAQDGLVANISRQRDIANHHRFIDTFDAFYQAVYHSDADKEVVFDYYISLQSYELYRERLDGYIQTDIGERIALIDGLIKTMMSPEDLDAVLTALNKTLNILSEEENELS